MNSVAPLDALPRSIPERKIEFRRWAGQFRAGRTRVSIRKIGSLRHDSRLSVIASYGHRQWKYNLFPTAGDTEGRFASGTGKYRGLSSLRLGALSSDRLTNSQTEQQRGI